MAKFELVRAIVAPPKGEAVRESGSGASFHASAGIQVCAYAEVAGTADGEATRGFGLNVVALALREAMLGLGERPAWPRLSLLALSWRIGVG